MSFSIMNLESYLKKNAFGIRWEKNPMSVQLFVAFCSIGNIKKSKFAKNPKRLPAIVSRIMCCVWKLKKFIQIIYCIILQWLYWLKFMTFNQRAEHRHWSDSHSLWSPATTTTAPCSRSSAIYEKNMICIDDLKLLP